MASDASPHLDFRIADWIVRPRLGRIERGDTTVHLTPRAMGVLVHLATRGGAVVSRNELLDAVWPRMAVTQDALSQCIVELRRAFGDDAKPRRVIETIPKIGVRLVPPVTPWPPTAAQPHDGAAPEPAPRRFSMPQRWVAAALLAVLLVAAVMLVVDAPTPSPELGTRAAAEPNREAQDFYVRGDDYTRRTNRAEALRYEEEQYRRAINETPTFALAWARLSRTHAAYHFLGIDRAPGRCALAEQSIRRALELEPDLPEGHLYLGNYYHRCRNDQQRALAEFAIAERSIPDNAELYFLRASVYRQLGDWERVLANGTKAIELDGRNAVYQRQQYISHLFLRDYDAAEALLDRLLDLHPDDATIYADKVFLALARNGDTELAERYDETRPTPDYASAPGYTYAHWLAAVFDGAYDEALRVLAADPAGSLPDGDLQPLLPKNLFYARTYALAGREDDAQRAFESAARDLAERLDRELENDRLTGPSLRMALAEARVGLGQHERAREIARETLTTRADVLSSSALRLAYVLRVLLPLGEHDAAIAELDAYFSEPGVWSIEGLSRDPRLAPLRGEPGFEALVAKFRR